ncbi:MAG: hypothetical protein PVG22_12895 [Chromatiales bacterium]|jgi:hypothetical protein
MIAHTKNITGIGNSTNRSGTESGSIITTATTSGSGRRQGRVRNLIVMIAAEKAATVTGTAKTGGTNLSAVRFLFRRTIVTGM